MKKILIIDDDSDFVEAMTTLLEAKDYTVVSAGNGEEGLAAAKKEKPNLVILDVMMTRKGEGFDVSRDFKNNQDTKDIPVIMVTGVRKEMNLTFGFDPDDTWLPVKAIIEKPVKPEALLKAVEENIK